MEASLKEKIEENKKKLTELQYNVTQKAHTEKAFTGEYTDFEEEGVYLCIVCHQQLYR